MREWLKIKDVECGVRRQEKLEGVSSNVSHHVDGLAIKEAPGYPSPTSERPHQKPHGKCRFLVVDFEYKSRPKLKMEYIDACEDNLSLEIIAQT